MNLVSIIIPCYNQAEFLPETLDSVLAQTYTNWECIIVNDGSHDNTDEVANAYCTKDHRFRYLYKENGGLSSARNAGIKASSGEFILPLDSDDLIGQYYIEKAISHFQNFPETKLVYCKAEFFGDQTGEWSLSDYSYEKLLFRNMIFCSSIYKKIDYLKTSGYRENMKYGLEDWDFLISFLDGFSIVYQIPDVLFYYRIRNNSMSRSFTDETYEYGLINIVKNNTTKYDQYFQYIIKYNNTILDQQELITNLEEELKKTRNSKAFKLGKKIILLIKKLGF